MVKRTFIVLLFAFSFLLLTACNIKTTTTTTNSKNTQTSSTEKTVPISIPSYTFTYPVVYEKDVIYASPKEVENADGSIMKPYSLNNAINKMNAGETIFLFPGTYEIEGGLTLSKAGSETDRNRIIALPNDIIFDFMKGDGLTITGSYWYIYNIKFINSSDTGCKVTGRNNIIEKCESYNNERHGFSCGETSPNSSYNQFRNCVAKENYGKSSYGFHLFGEGLDNSLYNCISYRNQQTGFYIYNKKRVLVTNCISISNGIDINGDLTSSGIGFDFSDSDHIFENCTAFNNGSGFYVKRNGGKITFGNSSSINNVVNYDSSTDGSTNIKISNSLSYNTSGTPKKDIIIGEATNCLFYVNNTYYYTGIFEKDINTIEEQNLGTELNSEEKEAYVIDIEFPIGFDPSNIITIDGFLFPKNFLDRNEEFQNMLFPEEKPITYFGSKYKTAE